MEERAASFPSLTAREEVEIVSVTRRDRQGLGWILDESFEGWYLRHSRATLRNVEVVRAAVSGGMPVGLVMLKMLDRSIGYVFYIAVAKSHRRRGIGKLLLDDALRVFKSAGVREVFASVEEDNDPSEALFASEGFARTTFSDVSKKYGNLHTLNMYRVMWVVPGEVLLRKAITRE